MRTFTLIAMICAVSSFNTLLAQKGDFSPMQEAIGVLARVSRDSVCLRWGAVNFENWKLGLREGFYIERYTLVRDNHVIKPEKNILTASPIRASELEAWQSLVRGNRYAAIAAQAMYGDDFVVNLDQAEVMTITNKATEHEQRFAFALFAADMSPSVARMSGLWFTDKSAKGHEKYLYRVVIQGDTSKRGSVFVNMTDSVDYPSPKGVSIKMEGHKVSLRWLRHDFPFFAWYSVERSTDSIHFESIAGMPVVTLSPTAATSTKFNYASDSIPEIEKRYFYRIRGVTPFGDFGSASEIVSVRSEGSVDTPPYITSATSIDNSSIRVEWDFALTENGVKGFMVERAGTDKGPFKCLTLQAPLPATARLFIDSAPLPMNYYRVQAVGHDNSKTISPSFLVALIDSFPPAPPIGLRAEINDRGMLKLTWQKNEDSDLYGYRVYKANHSTEEAFQVTQDVILGNEFSEQLNLKTLNSSVYYSVIAVDRNQNQSLLSTTLRVSLPDQIAPSPPVMLPAIIDSASVRVSWIKSSSQDVAQYDIYRSEEASNLWMRLRAVLRNDASVFIYEDFTAKASQKYKYSVVAIDSAGNESERARPIRGQIIRNSLGDAVRWESPIIQAELKSVRLRWNYESKNIIGFKLFKAIGDDAYYLFKAFPPNTREFVDHFQSEQKCRYKILALLQGEVKSNLSRELTLTF